MGGLRPAGRRRARTADGRRLRPELADVGRLARRGLRAVVGAARADERPRLSRILADHLGAAVHDVVEETWPGLRPRQRAGGPRRLAGRPGRSFELVGVVSEHGQPVELAELLVRPVRRPSLRPAARARRPASTSPPGRTGRCARACAAGSTSSPRTPGGRPCWCGRRRRSSGATRPPSRWSAPIRTPPPAPPPRSGPRPSSTTSSGGRCCRSARRCSGTAGRCCSSTAARRSPPTS